MDVKKINSDKKPIFYGLLVYVSSVIALFVLISVFVHFLDTNIGILSLALLLSTILIFGLAIFRKTLLLSDNKLRALAEELEAKEKHVDNTLAFQNLMMSNLPDIIFVKDSQFRIVQANDAFLNLYPEKIRDQVIGTTTFEAYNKQEVDVFLEQDKLAFKEGYTETEETILFPNGERHILRTRKIRFENEDGDIFILGVGHDITYEKNARDDLQTQKEYFRTLIDNLGVATFVINSEHKVTMWNKACEELSGMQAVDVIGSDLHSTAFYKKKRELLSDMIIDNDFSRAENLFLKPVVDSQLITGGKYVENWCDLKNGARRYLRIFSNPLFVDGKIKAAVQLMFDLSELKRAEEIMAVRQQEIQEQQYYFESLIDRFGAPAFVINLDHEVITWNRACSELTGIDAESLLGTKEHWRAFYKDERPCMVDFVIDGQFSEADDYYPEHFSKSDLIEGGVFGENWCDTENGSYYLRIFASPLFDNKGNLIAAIEVLFDLTELKESSDKLELQQQELQRSNRELEQFAYVASHDLQEPLRMVSSYTQLLAKRYADKLDEDANEFINYAVDGATRMQVLIHDLLQFSRINTQGEEHEVIEADSLFEFAITNLAATIGETDTIVSKGELPQIIGEASQLRQLFQNLIGNAVKYRDPDKKNAVHVSAERTGSEWQFCVKDNGIGIAEEHFDKVFVIFKRLHNKSDYKGTGIGLAICKKIVENHGGRIWIESSPGEGSAFFFTLPDSSL